LDVNGQVLNRVKDLVAVDFQGAINATSNDGIALIRRLELYLQASTVRTSELTRRQLRYSCQNMISDGQFL